MLLYLFLATICANRCLFIPRVDIAMRSTYYSICVLISSVLSVPIAQSDDYLLNSDENSDATFSGLYRIVNCGANQPARLNPEALQVKAFLPKAWQQLRYLLADVKLGTASKYGYAALFKTNDSIATISESFQDITNGAPIPPINYNPTLVCLHPDETVPLFRGLYDQGCAGGARAMASFPKLAHVGLCPAFFKAGKRGLDFPSPVDCPTLAANNTMTDARYSLVMNQYAFFVEEMLHLYLKGGSANEEQIEDGFPVQEAVNLNATASLANVHNWALYAACE